MIVAGSALRYAQARGRASADPFEGSPAEELSVRLVRLEGGRRRSPHRHPHSQEAIYVLSGNGVLWEDGIEHPVKTGDCVLIPAGVAHATIPGAGESMELLCFFPHPDLAANIEELDEIVVAGAEEERANNG